MFVFDRLDISLNEIKTLEHSTPPDSVMECIIDGILTKIVPDMINDLQRQVAGWTFDVSDIYPVADQKYELIVGGMPVEIAQTLAPPTAQLGMLLSPVNWTIT